MHQKFYSKYKITENKPMMINFMEHQVAYQYRCNRTALIMHSYTNWSEIEADLLWWARTMTSPCIWSPALKEWHIITYLQGSGLKYTVFSFNFSGIFKINDSNMCLTYLTTVLLTKGQNKNFSLKVDSYRS